jgi:hypothetical protein
LGRLKRTLQQGDHPEVTIVADMLEETLAALRAKKSGKDIWKIGTCGVRRGGFGCIAVTIRPG